MLTHHTSRAPRPNMQTVGAAVGAAAAAGRVRVYAWRLCDYAHDKLYYSIVYVCDMESV